MGPGRYIYIITIHQDQHGTEQQEFFGERGRSLRVAAEWAKADGLVEHKAQRSERWREWGLPEDVETEDAPTENTRMTWDRRQLR